MFVLRYGGWFHSHFRLLELEPPPYLNAIMLIKENIKLDKYTTFKVGGIARYFCRAQSIDDLKESVSFASVKNLKILVLAEGSNVLISDDGFPGLVIKMEIFGIEYDNNVIAGAGENLDSFIGKIVSENLYGIENLSGIPGTVGATPVQNVGAYGVEVSDIIKWVEVFNTKTSGIKKLSNIECNFSYRDSIFKEKRNYIITRVCFELKKEGKLVTHYKDVRNYLEEKNIINPKIEEIREIILKIRSNKFPDLKKFGTAGSFFKNPIVSEEKYTELLSVYPGLPGHPTDNGIKISLAWVLDTLGWKNKNDKNINVFSNQPLIIVSSKDASATEVKKFSEKIINDVKTKTGIEIVPEVTFIF